jgi:non-homologous end joining protein Ku
MARSSWTGALMVAGFPFHVKAYAINAKKADSFKTLCKCHGEPIAQKNTCRTTGDVCEETDKGVETAAGYTALSTDVIEQIGGAERSTVLEPVQTPHLASVPLDLSIGAYRLVADTKVAGAATPVAALWRTLRKSERAIITSWTQRAGSRDQLVAIHADDTGLVANVLPYVADIVAGRRGDRRRYDRALSLRSVAPDMYAENDTREE